MEFIIQKSIIPGIIILAAILSYALKKIDFYGAFTGAILAMIIWFGGRLDSLFSLFLFFIFGSFATSWKKDLKSQYKLVQENDAKRGISNVLANAGIAGILSIVALIKPDYQNLIILMIIAGFATACSDTLSSELGNVYGKKFFNILTLKPSTRGLDGTISIPGLWFGIIGSLLIALGTFPFHNDYKRMLIITVSGFSGNILDSVLGATLQQNGYINNHQVNFLATLFGSLFCLLLFILF